MSLFISIVSHGHDDLIMRLDCLKVLSRIEDVRVCVKSNKPAKLEFCAYLESLNISHLNENYFKGFGENNNIVFDFFEDNYHTKSSDIFICLNPDVIISDESLLVFKSILMEQNINFATLNLFLDVNFENHDFSIRRFPTFFTFLKSFFHKAKNYHYDKTEILKPIEVDWAAGSFLAFKFSLYRELEGFDERYFMYCEDVDICFRSKHLVDEPLIYIPSVKAVHLAKHENTNIFSKHFLWHIISSFRFLIRKKIILAETQKLGIKNK